MIKELAKFKVIETRQHSIELNYTPPYFISALIAKSKKAEPEGEILISLSESELRETVESLNIALSWIEWLHERAENEAALFLIMELKAEIIVKYL